MRRVHVVLVGLFGGIALVVALLAGIWLGGHPDSLPSPLRGGLFESRRAQPATEQALNILTTQYYRRLDRSSLVDAGLSGIVASLDDRYSRYLDPQAYRERSRPSGGQDEKLVATWEMVVYHGVRIGHLRLTGFPEGSGDELRADVRSALARHAQALLLDLRGNGGGLISQAINVASAFIERGELMSAEERGRPRRVYMAAGDAIAAQIPLVVLVDHGTASSAEIVTAALQDHGRAKVVGTDTYGKGVFQITERLVNGGALDISVGQFFTPDGRNLGGGGTRQGAGITPNIHASDDAGKLDERILAVGERTVAAEVKAG